MPLALTEANRQTLLLVVAILSMVCFFSSFLLFLCAAYIKSTIDARTRLIQTYNSDVLPGIFVFVGIVNLVQNISCIFVCLKLREVEKRDTTMKLAKPVLIGGIILVVFEVSTAIATFVHIGILEEEFGQGLRNGMLDYGKGEELKREMDSVQSSYGCCGDKSYTDWFEHKWLEGGYSDDVSGVNAEKYLQEESKLVRDDTPFSCCNVMSPRPCIHHHIHDNEMHHNYDYKVDSTLYKQGCREVLMDIYSNVLLVVGIIALVIASVKTVVLLLFRLLQSNLSKAQEMEDWETTAPAYILYYKDPEGDEEKDKDASEVDETDEDDTEGKTTDDQADKSETEAAAQPSGGDANAEKNSLQRPSDTSPAGRRDTKVSVQSRPSQTRTVEKSFPTDFDGGDGVSRSSPGIERRPSSVRWSLSSDKVLPPDQTQEGSGSRMSSRGILQRRDRLGSSKKPFQSSLNRERSQSFLLDDRRSMRSTRKSLNPSQRSTRGDLEDTRDLDEENNLMLARARARNTSTQGKLSARRKSWAKGSDEDMSIDQESEKSSLRGGRPKKKLNFDDKGEEPESSDTVTEETDSEKKGKKTGKKRGKGKDRGKKPKKKKKGKPTKGGDGDDKTESDSSEATDTGTEDEPPDSGSETGRATDTGTEDEPPDSGSETGSADNKSAKKGKKRRKGKKPPKKKKDEGDDGSVRSEGEFSEATDSGSETGSADSKSSKKGKKKGKKQGKRGKPAKNKKGKPAKDDGSDKAEGESSEGTEADTKKKPPDNGSETGSTDSESGKKGKKKGKKAKGKPQKKKGKGKNDAGDTSESDKPKGESSEATEADTTGEPSDSEKKEGSDKGSVEDKPGKKGKKKKPAKKKAEKKKGKDDKSDKSEGETTESEDKTKTESEESEGSKGGDKHGKTKEKGQKPRKKGKGKKKGNKGDDQRSKSKDESTDAESIDKESEGKKKNGKKGMKKPERQKKPKKGKNANAKVDSSGSENWAKDSFYNETKNYNESKNNQRAFFNFKPVGLDQQHGIDYLKKKDSGTQGIRTMASFGSGLLAKIKAHLSGDTKVNQNRDRAYTGKYKYSLLNTQSDDDDEPLDEEDGARDKKMLRSIGCNESKMSSNFFSMANNATTDSGETTDLRKRELMANIGCAKKYASNQQPCSLSNSSEIRNEKTHEQRLRSDMFRPGTSSPLVSYYSTKKTTPTSLVDSELDLSEDVHFLSLDSVTQYYEQNEILPGQSKNKPLRQTTLTNRHNIINSPFISNIRRPQFSQSCDDSVTFKEPSRIRCTPYPYEVLIYEEETSLESDLIPTKLKQNVIPRGNNCKDYDSTAETVFVSSSSPNNVGANAKNQITWNGIESSDNIKRSPESIVKTHDGLAKIATCVNDKFDCDMEVALINSTPVVSFEPTSNIFQTGGDNPTSNEPRDNSQLEYQKQKYQLSQKHTSFPSKSVGEYTLIKSSPDIQAKRITLPKQQESHSRSSVYFKTGRDLSMFGKHNIVAVTLESSNAKEVVRSTGNLVAMAQPAQDLSTSSSLLSPLSRNHHRSYQQKTLHVSPFSTSSSMSATPNANLVLSLSHSLDSPMDASTPVLPVHTLNTQSTSSVTSSQSSFTRTATTNDSWSIASSNNVLGITQPETQNKRRISMQDLHVPPATTVDLEQNLDNSSAHSLSVLTERSTERNTDGSAERPARERTLISPFN